MSTVTFYEDGEDWFVTLHRGSCTNDHADYQTSDAHEEMQNNSNYSLTDIILL